MASLITADDFFLATVALLKRHSVDIIPVDDQLDKKFADLYQRVFERENEEFIPVFNFQIDEVHGNSRGFRETMYAARFNNLVSLENPSFHRMKIKLSEEDASYLIESSDIASLIKAHLVDIFADDITHAHYQD